MSIDFWINVGVLAAIYGIFSLGLQLNVGFTGLANFGQAGFMAIGAYASGLLVVDWGWPLWAALVAGIVLAVGAGLFVGVSSLRLRADHFAMATIAFGEIVRYTLKTRNSPVATKAFSDSMRNGGHLRIGWHPSFLS